MKVGVPTLSVGHCIDEHNVQLKRNQEALRRSPRDNKGICKNGEPAAPYDAENQTCKGDEDAQGNY